MSRHDHGRSPKPWSKLKSRVEALFAPDLPLAVHCNVFVKVFKGFTFDEPRHRVVLGRGRAGRIIWDFPGPFLHTKPGGRRGWTRGTRRWRSSGRGSASRYLAADHDLTPEGYQARWGLPADYPLVAPDYADARSKLAKEAGLGRKRAPDAEATADAPAADPVPASEPEMAVPLDEGAAPSPTAKGRGRRKAAEAPSPE